MKYRYQISVVLSIFYIQVLVAKQVDADSMLRHHLEKSVVLSASTGDPVIEEISSQLLFLYKLMLMQDFIIQLEEMHQEENVPELAEQRIKELVLALEKAVDDCFAYQRITVVDWPEKEVKHQHANPICYSLRSFHQFVLERYAARTNRTPEQVQEDQSHEDYMK